MELLEDAAEPWPAQDPGLELRVHTQKEQEVKDQSIGSHTWES